MRTRNNNNGGGRMANMLRAVDAYVAHDSGGVEEVAQAANEPNEPDGCGHSGCSRDIEWFCEECDRYFCGHHFAWRETAHRLCWPCYEKHRPACETGRLTCHTCGAPVEPDALARQTLADGSLMWPEPFCRACLLAGLRRLKAWLATGGAGMMGEDGE